jgi:hypothetical protein
VQDDVRNKVATILFIPAQFVMIAGVEPSLSLLKALMIPERYGTILESLLEDHFCTTEMKELAIDYVEKDKVYNVEGECHRQDLITSNFRNIKL